jgi:glycosyltransferase involved in cell wall biosynthesis
MPHILALSFRLEQHALYIYDTLTALGHTVTLCSLRPSEDPSLRKPRFEELPPRCLSSVFCHVPGLGEMVFFSFDVSAALALFKRRREIDAVIAHGLFFLPTVALLGAAKVLRIPFVAQVFNRPRKYESRRHWAVRALRRWYFKSADAIVAAGDWRALCELGVRSDKIFRMDPFIDFEAAPSEPAPRMQGERDAVTVAYCGQLVPYKGVRDLLRAIVALRQRGRNLRLLLIGGHTPEAAGVQIERELRDEAALTGGDFMEITGWIPRSEVRRRMMFADIFAFPSHVDTFPKAVMEAMASRVPLVVSDACGCVGPLVRHNENALVYEAGDVRALAAAIEKVAIDPGLGARLASNALADVSRCTPDRAAEAYRKAVDSVLARRATPVSQTPVG